MANKCNKCGKEIKQGHPLECNVGVKVSHNHVYVPAALKKSIFEQPMITFSGNGILLKSGAQPSGQIMNDEMYEQNLKQLIIHLQQKLSDFSAGTDFNRN